MKTNGKHEVIARIAGPGLVLGALLAMVLSTSSAGRAQSRATSPAVPAATPAKAAPATQARQPAAPAARRPGGNHEGIHVHGHWMIDVRNPDGKLASHAEFENALQPTGSDILTGLLSGVYVAGGFVVSFNTGATPAIASNEGGSGLCGEGVCSLWDPRIAYTAVACPTASANAGGCGLLTINANSSSVAGYSNDAAGFTLSGTITNIPGGGQIQSVASGLFYCFTGGTTALSSTAFVAVGSQQCGAEATTELPPQDFISGAPIVLTGATLPQSNTTTTPCGGTGQVPCAVTVTADQSVNVSVIISFSSGSQ